MPVCCFAFACFVASADAAPTEKDLVRAVLDHQAAAWNKGDLEGFMAGYWKSPDLSFFSGNDKTFGWDATLARYRKKYQADKKEMGKLAFKDVSIEILGAGHALVRGRYQLTLSKETATGIFTLLLRKMPEGWRIVHDHTSN
ncbi:MAG: nuclear transport factor 2 family protein [Gemmataceae bacterium]